jgi:hypothetical protein
MLSYLFVHTVPTVGTDLQRRVSISMGVEQEKQKLENIVANKNNLKPLELALQKIELISSDIRLDMYYMREREAQHRDANGTDSDFSLPLSRISPHSCLNISIFFLCAMCILYRNCQCTCSVAFSFHHCCFDLFVSLSSILSAKLLCTQKTFMTPFAVFIFSFGVDTKFFYQLKHICPYSLI